MLGNRIIPFLFTLFLIFWNIFAILQGYSCIISYIAAGLLSILCFFEADDILHTLMDRRKRRRSA